MTFGMVVNPESSKSIYYISVVTFSEDNILSFFPVDILLLLTFIVCTYDPWVSFYVSTNDSHYFWICVLFQKVYFQQTTVHCRCQNFFGREYFKLTLVEIVVHNADIFTHTNLSEKQWIVLQFIQDCLSLIKNGNKFIWSLSGWDV